MELSRAKFGSKKRRVIHSLAMNERVTPVINGMKDKVSSASFALVLPAVVGLNQVVDKINDDISKAIGVVGAAIGYYLSDKNSDSNKGKLVTAGGSFALGLVAHGVANYFGLPEIAADIALPLFVGIGLGVLTEAIVPISSFKN